MDAITEKFSIGRTILFCFLFLLGGKLILGEDHLQVSDLTLLLKNNFDRIQNFKITCVIDGEMLPPDANVEGVTGGGASSKEIVYVRDGGLMRIHCLRYKDAQRKKIGWDILTIWDGGKSHQWSRRVDEENGNGLAPNGQPEGKVSGIVSNTNLCEGSFEYLNFLNWLRLVKKESIQIVQISVDMHSRPCVLLEGKNVRLWVDQERGCLIKFERYWGGKREDLFTSIELTKFQEFEGIWMPIEAQCAARWKKSLEVNKTGSDVLYKRRLTINPTSVKVNQNIDKSLFQMDFPPSAPVYDETTKTWSKPLQQGNAGGPKSESTIEQRLEQLADQAVKNKNAVSK